jgi:hypothetical protein
MMELKTKNTIIQIDSIQYYAGLIPVLSGKITVLPQAIELKGLKDKQTEAMQLAKEAFKFYIDMDNSFFAYSFHISMPYIGTTFNYFKLDFGNYHDAETIRIAFIYLTKMCIQFNRAINEAEKAILKYQTTLSQLKQLKQKA